MTYASMYLIGKYPPLTLHTPPHPPPLLSSPRFFILSLILTLHSCTQQIAMLGNVYSLHTLVVENKTSTLFYAYIINRLLITSFDAKRTSQPIFRPILGLFLQVSNKRDQQLQRDSDVHTTEELQGGVSQPGAHEGS